VRPKMYPRCTPGVGKITTYTLRKYNYNAFYVKGMMPWTFGVGGVGGVPNLSKNFFFQLPTTKFGTW
jgi:hypothetical protein